MAETRLVKPKTTLQVDPKSRHHKRRVSIDVDTLTPDMMRAYLRRADKGDPSAQAELFAHMEERDTLLDGHLRTRKLGVARCATEIVAPQDSGAAGDRSVALVQEQLDGLDEWDQSVLDLLDAVGKGFSVVEIEWETSASEWRVVDLHYRPQSWFGYLEDDETIGLLDDKGNVQPLNTTNFIVNKMQARSGLRATTALLRSLVRPFVVRHFGWKDWMGFLDVFGMPLRLGHLPTGVDFESDEAQTFWSMLLNMGSDMAAMLPDGWELEFIGREHTGDGGVFEKTIKLAEIEMTIAVLGQLLTSRGEQGGSYALGRVHNQVRIDLLEADARALSKAITHQLIKPIVWFNLGERAPVPQYVITVEEPEDLGELASAVSTLSKDVGLPVPAQWLYEKFGIPEPQPDEPVLVGGLLVAAPRDEDLETPERTPPGRATTEPPDSSEEDGVSASLRMRNRRVATHRAHLTTKPQWANAPGFASWCGWHGLCFDCVTSALNQADPFIVDDLEALMFLSEKRLVSDEVWDQMTDVGHARGWHVQGLAMESQEQVATLVMDAAAQGRGVGWFLEECESRGLAVTGAQAAEAGQMANWHARLVYHNNIVGARHASAWMRLQETKATRPYGEWVVGPQVCPICEPLAGQVAPLDGELFKQFWPPLHHACQCEVVSVGQREVEREGVNVNDTPPDMEQPAPWTFNPGDAYYLEARGGGPVTQAGWRQRDWLNSGRVPPLPTSMTDKLGGASPVTAPKAAPRAAPTGPAAGQSSWTEVTTRQEALDQLEAITGAYIRIGDEVELADINAVGETLADLRDRGLLEVGDIDKFQLSNPGELYDDAIRAVSPGGRGAVGVFDPETRWMVVDSISERGTGLAPSFGDVWNVDESLQGVTRHEVGHAIHSRQYSPPARQARTRFASSEVSNEARNSISQYGRTNDAEAWAEAFSAYSSPRYERGSLPSSIESIFDDLFAGGGV